MERPHAPQKEVLLGEQQNRKDGQQANQNAAREQVAPCKTEWEKQDYG
jgi:hypothetical protein